MWIRCIKNKNIPCHYKITHTLKGWGYFIIFVVVFIIYPSVYPARYPDEYQITDYAAGDLDQDGEDEMIVLLWKPGYYGSSRPFWQAEQINDYGQHLFIYELQPKRKMKWGSSTINYEIKSISFENNNLIVNKIEYWQWDDFGLTRFK